MISTGGREVTPEEKVKVTEEIEGNEVVRYNGGPPRPLNTRYQSKRTEETSLKSRNVLA
jgi:hypothetical protein